MLLIYLQIRLNITRTFGTVGRVRVSYATVYDQVYYDMLKLSNFLLDLWFCFYHFCYFAFSVFHSFVLYICLFSQFHILQPLSQKKELSGEPGQVLTQLNYVNSQTVMRYNFLYLEWIMLEYYSWLFSPLYDYCGSIFDIYYFMYQHASCIVMLILSFLRQSFFILCFSDIFGHYSMSVFRMKIKINFLTSA